MNVKTDTNSYTTTNLKGKRYNMHKAHVTGLFYLRIVCMYVQGIGTHMLPVLRLHKSTPNKSTKNVTHGYHH